MNSTATPPLVSIVVRSVGRPSLSRALASIARQTWRPLEVILVDAANKDLAAPSLPDIAVRTTGHAILDRPRAANAGLVAARGQWIGFLDEDDEIESDHVALLMAVGGVSGLPVAYSQTRMVTPAGERVFGGPFDRAALKRSNYISIHAVLFHRRFVDLGVRFDESLATFEDWDFWLQLAEKSDFAFSGRPTAIYHAAAGASGAGSAANLDREAMLLQRNRLMHKWGAT